MFLATLVCAGLLGTADDPVPVAAPDVAAEYRAARSAAGRTPSDQVRLALWCEAHGLPAERMRHLALALLADPANATARGLAGLVARDGRWVAPDAVAAAARADEASKALLAEYDLRRSKAAYTAEAQWALGQWADERGLQDQARAHYTAVTRLDPAREIAWKRLGYSKHDGRWATDAQLAAAKAEADAQKQADQAWRPPLERWKSMIDRPSKRDEARVALLGVTDPRALPMIARVFGTNRAGDQQVAVALLGQIESPQASRSLAALAVLSSSPDVRRAAVETLRHRDPRDFVGALVASIRTPIKYEVRRISGVGQQGTLLIHGQRSNIKRLYTPTSLPGPLPKLIDRAVTYDKDGLPVITGETWTWADWSGSIRGRDAVALIFGGAVGPQGPPLAGQINAPAFARTQEGPTAAADLARLRAQALAANPGQSAQVAAAFTRLAQGPASAAAGSFAGINFLGPGLNAPIITDAYDGLLAVRDDGSREPFDPDRIYQPVYGTEVRIPIGQMIVDARASSELAKQRLDGDVAVLEAANLAMTRANDPVKTALREVTGKDFDDDGVAWGRWWTDQQGYALAGSTPEVPTVVEEIPTGYTPVAVPTSFTGLIGVNHSCFAAGTSVRTVDGTKPIESIRRGDLVLVEDTLSGALSYQPVLTAFHNPPSSTYRVKLGDDEVVATGIHRFWKAGHGWAMARDLKAGDSLRVLGGVATVAAVTHEATQPVFNLEVAEGRSFFVGRLGALVHDNSPVEATPSPFDAAGAAGPVAAAAAR